MKQLGIAALASAIASTAAPVPHVRTAPAALSTARTVEQFAACFVAAQDRAGSAWSYVPKSNGGTFSNAGAAGVPKPYFLAVADRGSRRELRLEPASAAIPVDAVIARAVDQCA